MNPSNNPNADLLLSAAEKLAPLLDRIVFVGGCAAGLLITDPGAAPVRPTIDVDAIIRIESYVELIALEARLRQLGFEQPRLEGAPLCRWIHGKLILDLMPTDPAILGFSNRWYPQAFENVEIIKVGDYQIRMISAPYFLATKLEAFHGRGRSDCRMSRDVEDIVTVIDGRPEIVSEVQAAATPLRKYLSGEFSSMLANSDFLDALPGHLLPDAVSQQRLRIVMDRIKQFAGGT